MAETLIYQSYYVIPKGAIQKSGRYMDPGGAPQVHSNKIPLK